MAKHTGHSRGSKLSTLKESVAEKDWGKLHQDEHLKRGIAEEDWKALGYQWRKLRPAAEKALPALGFLLQKELAPEKPAKGMWEQVLCERAIRDWTPPGQRFWASLSSSVHPHSWQCFLFMNKLFLFLKVCQWSGSLPWDTRP